MDIYILGAGGFGRELASHINACRVAKLQAGGLGEIPEVLGYIDDNADIQGETRAGFSVLGDFSYLEKFDLAKRKNSYYVTATGNVGIRKRIKEKAEGLGLKPAPPLVYPNVVITQFVTLGRGTVICPSCVLTVDIEIGSHVHIHSDCTLGHDVKVGDYANISPGAHLCGGCIIAEGADIGTGANVLPGVTVGAYAIVGSGAVVNRDVPPHTIVVGVPARPLRKKNRGTS